MRERQRRYSGAMTDIARNLRRESTSAEARLWEIVRGRRCDGLRFVRQAPVAHYVLDFYCPSVRLAIEIDGSIHDEESVRERDKERQELLEQEQGITFLRLSNQFVLDSVEADICTAIVDAATKSSENLFSHPHPARRV
jgi:very-short-patch-repair endonuclease